MSGWRPSPLGARRSARGRAHHRRHGRRHLRGRDPMPALEACNRGYADGEARRARGACRAATAAHPLTGDRRDYDALLELVGDARIVLIGEATHGTHEFYRERGADHQAADRGEGLHAPSPSRPTGPTPIASTATSAARGRTPTPRRRCAAFARFPTWMWRNADVLDFVGWLRTHNDRPDRGPGRSASTASTSTASAPRWRP